MYGQTDSSDGVGVFGQNGSAESGTGNLTFSAGFTGGVWGDGGTVSDEIGVLGTVDDGYAGFFVNNTAGRYSMWVQDVDAGWSHYCRPRPNVGSLTAFCDIDHRATSTAPEPRTRLSPLTAANARWPCRRLSHRRIGSKISGSAKLVNGVAVVALDPDFIQTVNTDTNYKVFPVPNGDCKGLYVTNKTANSFEVRELGGGTSNVSFDYRITALRRNYENVRFADRTHDMDGMKVMQERARTGTTRPQSHKSRIPSVPMHETRVASISGGAK